MGLLVSWPGGARCDIATICSFQRCSWEDLFAHNRQQEQWQLNHVDTSPLCHPFCHEQTWTNHETVSYGQLPQRDECPYPQSRDDHALQLQRLDPELSTRQVFLDTGHSEKKRSHFNSSPKLHWGTFWHQSNISNLPVCWAQANQAHLGSRTPGMKGGAFGLGPVESAITPNLPESKAKKHTQCCTTQGWFTNRKRCSSLSKGSERFECEFFSVRARDKLPVSAWQESDQALLEGSEAVTKQLFYTLLC